MTTSQNFPPELHDVIIDHLHDQKRVLGTCGLVNKSWLRSSRHHLFGSVTLRDDSWKDFLQLLESPLATFPQSIEALTVSLSDDDEETAISFHDLVSQLRGLPTALRRLRLENVLVTETTAASLGTMFPDVRELDLYQVGFDTPWHMATLVSRFLRLRTASVYPVFLKDGDLQVSHYPEIPRNLERLRLRLGVSAPGPFPEVARWFDAGETPPAIRVLEIGILDAASLHSVGNLLRVLGPELHDLNLKLMYHVTSDDVRTHLDLSRNANIHSLTIHLSLRRFQRASSVHAPWALLSVPRSPISTLTLVLSIDVVDLIDNLDWALLNTALKTYPQFTSLRRLNFIVHCFSAMDNMDKAIRERVPEYDERGIVDVSMLHTSRIFTHAP
ncbi:hypothetical protein K438DRAFT_1797991 [Mycena galopus ATCC 62051]|nr:hypothetical protein K438DRAFT_1797991 [Mycena galopus ATCC 62051]